MQKLKPMLEAPLMSRQQVARLLSVSESTVDRLRKRENDPLPSVQVGGQIRHDPVAVSQWIKRQQKRGGFDGRDFGE